MATQNDNVMQDSAAQPSVRDTIGRKAEELRDQALGKAQDYAEMGKEKATGALDSMARLLDNTAGSIDESLGDTVGGYVHRAADAINEFADSLRDKDVEELLSEARDMVKRHPAIAIGAAAAAGFLIARVLRSGGSEELEAEAGLDPAAPDAGDIDIAR